MATFNVFYSKGKSKMEILEKMMDKLAEEVKKPSHQAIDRQCQQHAQHFRV